jgi:hypothetical protein
MAQKLVQWFKAFMRWTKKNPIKAGLMTFVPVMVLAGLVKMSRGFWKRLGLIEKGYPSPAKISGGDKRIEGEWGWGLDDVKKFGGSTGGLERILNLARMFV